VFTLFTLIATYFQPKSQFLTNFHEPLVSTVTGLRVGRPRNRGLIPGRGKSDFSSPKMSGEVLGSTQLPSQWVPEIISQGT
jgi:hypothetical protein